MAQPRDGLGGATRSERQGSSATAFLFASIVVEAKDPIPAGEIGIAPYIAWILRMLFAIDLDNEISFPTRGVGDERPDRFLS